MSDTGMVLKDIAQYKYTVPWSSRLKKKVTHRGHSCSEYSQFDAVPKAISTKGKKTDVVTFTKTVGVKEKQPTDTHTADFIKACHVGTNVSAMFASSDDRYRAVVNVIDEGKSKVQITFIH